MWQKIDLQIPLATSPTPESYGCSSWVDFFGRGVSRVALSPSVQKTGSVKSGSTGLLWVFGLAGCSFLFLSGSSTAWAFPHDIYLNTAAVSGAPSSSRSNDCVQKSKPSFDLAVASGEAALAKVLLRDKTNFPGLPGNATGSPAVNFSLSGIFTSTANSAAEYAERFNHLISNEGLTSTATVDVVIEDQTTSAPVIEIWDGLAQSFGEIGQPQTYINILGEVSDNEGVQSLVYTLNGGSTRNLTLGSDNRRLWNEGDFNVDIETSVLLDGANEVVIVATDTFGNSSSVTVDVSYDSSTTWPSSYDIDWSEVTRISDVAQIIDGNWELTPYGPRIGDNEGYDRLLGFGDVSWTDYEITSEFKIHGYDEGYYAGVGLITRWTGHTDLPEAIGGLQPKSGFLPYGALGWMAWFPPTTASRMQIRGYQLAKDIKRLDYVLNQSYNFKYRTETISPTESLYRMKVWASGQNEPFKWDVSYTDDLNQTPLGAALFIAHHIDVSFGDVSIRPVVQKSP